MYRSQIKGQYEENYSEMEDIVYCISTKEFMFFWAVVALNLLSVLVMCYVTRRQCVGEGVWRDSVTVKLYGVHIQDHL